MDKDVQAIAIVRLLIEKLNKLFSLFQMCSLLLSKRYV